MAHSPIADPYCPTPSVALRLEQATTLNTPPRAYGALARLLFRTLDWVYGRANSLPKFVVLELVARVPYQAWENVGYVAISHTATRPRFARRIFDYVAGTSALYAEALAEGLLARGEQLEAHPESGRMVPELCDPAVREVIHGAYRVVYELGGSALTVLTVFRGSRQFPLDR